MSLRYALLGALADSPRTGYALLKHFEQSLAYAWPASHSQIYPELARLLEAGLIEQAEAGARGSKTYAITKAGLEDVRRWLRDTEPDRRVRNEAALRTFFLWLLDAEEAAAQLERERAYWTGVLEEYRADRGGADREGPKGARLPHRPGGRHRRRGGAARVARRRDRGGPLARVGGAQPVSSLRARRLRRRA